MTELEHIVSARVVSNYGNVISISIPKRNDDELCVLRPILDIIGDNGDITEVKSCIDLVHKVQRCRLSLRLVRVILQHTITLTLKT
jgi:hypothetical protein